MTNPLSELTDSQVQARLKIATGPELENLLREVVTRRRRKAGLPVGPQAPDAPKPPRALQTPFIVRHPTVAARNHENATGHAEIKAVRYPRGQGEIAACFVCGWSCESIPGTWKRHIAAMKAVKLKSARERGELGIVGGA